MAGYGRFRKSGKVNRSRGGMYRNSITSGYGSYSKGKKTTYRGYYLGNKGVEKKYTDKAWVVTSWLPQVISWEVTGGQSSTGKVQGMKYMGSTRHATGK